MRRIRVPLLCLVAPLSLLAVSCVPPGNRNDEARDAEVIVFGRFLKETRACAEFEVWESWKRTSPSRICIQFVRYAGYPPGFPRDVAVLIYLKKAPKTDMLTYGPCPTRTVLANGIDQERVFLSSKLPRFQPTGVAR